MKKERCGRAALTNSRLSLNRLAIPILLAGLACGATQFGRGSVVQDDWAEVSGILSGIQGVFTSPVDEPRNKGYAFGALLGNGEIGVVVNGGSQWIRLYVGKNGFWSTEGRPHISAVGTIDIKTPNHEKNAPFRMTQDIKAARVRVDFSGAEHGIEADLWTADNRNLIVAELSAEGGEPMPVTVTLSATNYQCAAGTNGAVLYVTKEGRNAPNATAAVTNTNQAAPAFVCRALMAARVLGAEAILTTDGQNLASAQFTLQPGKPVRILTLVESVKDEPLPVDTAIRDAAKLDEPAVRDCSQFHLDYWKAFWLKSFIKLDDETLQRFWYGHLYALACCSRPGCYAPGLFGNFILHDHMGWCGNLHANYNMQNPYYGVYASNRPELASPYYDAVQAYAPTARERVRQRKGISKQILRHMPTPCRGIEFAVGITPFGCESEPEDWGQPSNAAFSLVPFVWHWKYTQDEDFLRNRAYPLLLEVADFYEDYIGAKEDDGRYHVYGGTYETGPWEPIDWFQKDGILDLGAIRFLFTNLIEASIRLGVDADRRDKWRDILENLADFPTELHGGKRVYRADSVHGAKDYKRINVCLVHWAGWDMLSRASDPLTLETVRNTLDVVNKWTTGNDFGIAPVLGIKAFYEPEKIIEKIKSSPWRNNLTVFQDGGGIETSGIVEAINAMLLQSHDGVIRVFPNWPSHTGAKFKRLRAQGAFLVDAEFSSPETKTLAVYSEAGKTCSIENPWPGQTLKVSANGSRNIATRRQGEIYTFNTSPGTRYILTRKDN